MPSPANAHALQQRTHARHQNIVCRIAAVLTGDGQIGQIIMTAVIHVEEAGKLAPENAAVLLLLAGAPIVLAIPYRPEIARKNYVQETKNGF